MASRLRALRSYGWECYLGGSCAGVRGRERNCPLPQPIASAITLVSSLPPDGPAAAVEAVEEHGEAACAERQQAAAGSDAAEEQVADAEEHGVDQREAQHPVEEVVAEGGVVHPSEQARRGPRFVLGVGGYRSGLQPSVVHPI